MIVSLRLLRAKRFAEEIERQPVDGAPVDPLVDLARQLGRVHTPDPDPQFAADLRAMLMATAERDGIGATAVDPDLDFASEAPTRNRIRRVAMIGVIVGAVTVSGVATASGSATPGGALYPVRLRTEQAQLALMYSPTEQGKLYLSFAANRADEAATLTHDYQVLKRLLGVMDQQTAQGMRLLISDGVDHRNKVSLDLVATFIDSQSVKLQKVLDGTVGSAHTRTAESMALLDANEDRVDALREDLKCCPLKADTSPTRTAGSDTGELWDATQPPTPTLKPTRHSATPTPAAAPTPTPAATPTPADTQPADPIVSAIAGIVGSGN